MFIGLGSTAVVVHYLKNNIYEFICFCQTFSSNHYDFDGLPENVIWSWFVNFDCKGRSSEINMFMWNLCLFQCSYQLVTHSLQTYKQRPRNNKNTYVWVVSNSYEMTKQNCECIISASIWV